MVSSVDAPALERDTESPPAPDDVQPLTSDLPEEVHQRLSADQGATCRLKGH